MGNSVTDLRPDDTPENPFWYTFKVQCTSCREIHPNFVNVSRFVRSPKKMSESLFSWLTRLSAQEANDMSGSRGEANFVWRCKSCKVPTVPHFDSC